MFPMHRDARNAIPVFLITSPIDFPIMAWRTRALPILPTFDDLNRGRPGSWAHSGKDWWSCAFRADAQYWSKLCRFIVWWLVVIAAL